MNAITTQGIFLLIKSALTGEKLALPEGFDLESGRMLIKKHQIENMVYYGAVNCGLDPQSAIMRDLFVATCRYLHISERQQYEMDRIRAAFEANGIDHMPLKGVLMKRLYPRPDMRIMGDADVLIRVEQYETIKPLLTARGFTEKLESDHELIWEKPNLYLELHKRVIPSYNYDYAAYFGDGWRLAQPCADKHFCYEMSKEDQMIYLFTHFSKHYRDGGIGIRHFTDLYVYRNAYPELDETYIEKELKVLQLDVFYMNICAALEKVYDNGPGNDATDIIIATILGSGVYGTKDRRITASGAREKASGNSVKQVRRNRWLRLIVPPYGVMCEKYPILEKAAILLPAMWVVRWVSALTHKRQTIRTQSKQMQVMTEEHIENYEQALRAVGLAFNFEE